MDDSYPAKTWWEETRGAPSGYWTAFRPFCSSVLLFVDLIYISVAQEDIVDGLKLADVAFRDNPIRHTTISGK